MSYTPGPWRINRHGYESSYQAWEFIESEYGSPVAGIWDPTGTGEQFANARLIAAAPDLLAALEKIADPSLNFPTWQGAVERMKDIAREAIAKATGEKP